MPLNKKKIAFLRICIAELFRMDYADTNIFSAIFAVIYERLFF